MIHATTAEELFLDLKQLPEGERQRFFAILSERAFGDGDMSHEQLFGHLADDRFSASEAAEYLEISMSTLRRYVASGKLSPVSMIGRSQMFSSRDLKALKRASCNSV